VTVAGGKKLSMQDSLCTLAFRGWKSPKEACRNSTIKSYIFEIKSLRCSGAYMQPTVNNALIDLKCALF
jgi:hypothetical protein